MFKDFKVLVARAIICKGMIYDTRTLLCLFSYSQTTYPNDTTLIRSGLVKKVPEGWLVTGNINKPKWGVITKRLINQLPDNLKHKVGL